MGWEMVVKSKADSRQLELIRALRDRGVVFKICGNTLNERTIDVADLAVPGVIVPAGVAEITRLQMAGSTYIKP